MLRALVLSSLCAWSALAEEAPLALPEVSLVDAGSPAAVAGADDDSDDADSDDAVAADESADTGEAEVATEAPAEDSGNLYSADLSDAELAELFSKHPEELGSVSFGLVEAGRLMNGVQVPQGDAWTVVDANNAWGTRETVEFILDAATRVHDQFPAMPPLRINHIGRKNGGYLRPHQSHQAGRDVDIGFFYPAGEDPGHLSKRRMDVMDLPTNWALIKTLVAHADVQFILVDRRIQARLYDFALKLGESKAWLDRLFHAGAASLIRHARGHRDHFHVRFFSPRSQELGRRIQPMLSKQPDENLTIYRVKKGDTLGGIALRFNSSVKLIQKANGMTNTSLRVGRTLNVPLRGPCTNCPLPPALNVPARCLPPPPPDKS